jgi:hypothetical protein
MKNIYVLIIVFGVLGLVIGYLFFGKISGEYIDINAIFSNSGGSLGSFGRKVSGIQSIRQNILISGGVGGIIGVVVFYMRKKK